MNAASTVPTAPAVCPIDSVRSRSQTTSYNSAAAPERPYRRRKRRLGRTAGSVVYRCLTWCCAVVRSTPDATKFEVRSSNFELSRERTAMRNVIGLLAIGFVCATAGAVMLRAAGMPLWAYGYVDPPPASSDYSQKCTAARPVDCARGGTPPDDGRKRTLPGGTGEWTVTEAANDYGPVDWYPGDHPKMPEIVAHGRRRPASAPAPSAISRTARASRRTRRCRARRSRTS